MRLWIAHAPALPCEWLSDHGCELHATRWYFVRTGPLAPSRSPAERTEACFVRVGPLAPSRSPAGGRRAPPVHPTIQASGSETAGSACPSGPELYGSGYRPPAYAASVGMAGHAPPSLPMLPSFLQGPGTRVPGRGSGGPGGPHAQVRGAQPRQRRSPAPFRVQSQGRWPWARWPPRASAGRAAPPGQRLPTKLGGPVRGSGVQRGNHQNAC